MPDRPDTACPSALLSPVVAALGRGDAAAMTRLNRLLADYPRDPQLHFLNGSMLAASSRFAEAHEAMSTAVAIAPNYSLARFQLGLLELSSGMPREAEATWAPLDTLPADAPLRLFSTGLRRLIRDEFDQTVELLRRGIALNSAHPAMNSDMQLIISRIEQRDADRRDDAVSAAHFLLRQYSGPTRH